MTYRQVPFLQYAWQDPDARFLLFVMAGSVLAAIVIAGFMCAMNTSLADEIAELEEEARPQHVLHYSKHGELQIFWDHARFFRSGSYISSELREVWDVTWNDSRTDRVLDIRHMGDHGPVTESVHCGPADIFEVMKIRDMLLHYVGG